MVQEQRVVHRDRELQCEDYDARYVRHLLAEIVRQSQIEHHPRSDRQHEEQRHDDRGDRQQQHGRHQNEHREREPRRLLIHHLFELQLLVPREQRVKAIQQVLYLPDGLLDVGVVGAPVERYL